MHRERSVIHHSTTSSRECEGGHVQTHTCNRACDYDDIMTTGKYTLYNI